MVSDELQIACVTLVLDPWRAKVSHKVQTGLNADLIPTGLKILCIASDTPLIYGITAVVSGSLQLPSISLCVINRLNIKPDG